MVDRGNALFRRSFLCQDALDRLADGALRQALLEVHARFSTATPEPEATCLCHNDLNLGNVLVAW